MAVLQNIRNRAGILILIFVGVALFLSSLILQHLTDCSIKLKRTLLKLTEKKCPIRNLKTGLTK